MNNADVKNFINTISKTIYEKNKAAGWWSDLKYADKSQLVADLLEVSTGTENAYALAAHILDALGVKENTETTRNVGEILCLIHSEISEAMEGHRKNLMDDKLPHRKMLEVELADAMIRIFDLAGAHGMDLGGAIVEKLAYNSTRADHKKENRLADGGKAY